MTTDAFGAERPASGWRTQVLGATSIACLWMLFRPYAGIVHDAPIYVGRALADLSPHSVGLEFAFLHDGQSQFSLFPRLLAWLVRQVGVSVAAETVAAVGLLLWVLAAAYLLSRFFRGVGLWAALACLAALPGDYGGHGVFSWAEAFATPRIFGEAASLAALALLMDGRRAAAACLLAVGLSLHPLMALPAGAAGGVYLGLSDRRWLLLFPVALILGVAAALWGAPVAGRLFQGIDREWLFVLEQRVPYLFPTRWPAVSWSLVVCQATTLALARREASPKLRRLIDAIVVVGALGVLVGAASSTLLIVQLQLWRAAWLASFLAAALFAACAAGLWRRGAASRATVVMLAAAWVGRETLSFAAFSCAVALVLAFVPRAKTLPPLALRLIWIYGLLAVAVLSLIDIGHLFRMREALAFGPWLAAPAVFSTSAVRLGLTAIAVWAILRRNPLRTPAWAALTATMAAAAGVVLCSQLWDARAPFVRMLETKAGAPPLAATLGAGSVEWLDTSLDISGNSWLLTGAPEWWSLRQGAGAVFDRQLAVEWERRFKVLSGAGLVASDLDRLVRPPTDRPPVVSESGVRQACRANDGPTWIVAPTWRVEPRALPKSTAVWRSPAPYFVPEPAGGRTVAVWTYAIFSCAKLRSPSM